MIDGEMLQRYFDSLRYWEWYPERRKTMVTRSGKGEAPAGDSRKTVYYAHCMALYGTKQEARDIITLEAMGFRVYNPNNEGVEMTCSSLRHAGYDTGWIMENFFRPLVESFDFLAFRALPDGRIPKGVHSEVKWAMAAGIDVIEMPFAIETRGMTVEQTREYLREVGYR